MEINRIQIEFVSGKLSDYAADAYVLPYYPHHVNPDNERQDVELAGARGVRSFIEHRLRQNINHDQPSMGDVKITESQGGKSRMLVNMICRSKNPEQRAIAIARGLLGMLLYSGRYNLQHVAMSPLCVCDGLSENDFAEILRNSLQNCPSGHSIRKITVVCKDKAQSSKFEHILE